MAHSDKTGQDRRLYYALAILLLPVLVLWRHDDPLYTPLWQTDPWFYLGYFKSLVNFKRDLFPNYYYGSRLTWILPGYVLHKLLPALGANAILHLGVHSTAALSMFTMLRRTIGLRSAYLTAMIFSFHPWFWAATGWDHVNGGAIAYYLLAAALVTRAAAQADPKWSLLFAGMAIAGAVYAHLFLVALTPLVLLQYLTLTWAWRGAPVTRLLPALCLWIGAGFALVTVPLCLINGLLVDGNFWFWTPSLHTAQAVTANYIWTESLWFEGRPAQYLWIIGAASAVALLLLPYWWKQAVRDRKPAGLMFCGQLLFFTALMVWLQSRGITLLGHYYYACYLFPFVFPVLGAAFYPAVDGVSTRDWKIIWGGATLLFALPSVNPESNATLVRLLPEWLCFALAGCLLLAGLRLRERIAGTWLALAGLAMLTVITYNGIYHWVPLHSTREEYARVMAARQRIEQDREGMPVRFWYDKSEPGWFEYFALNAAYMAEFARIGETFPAGCKGAVEPGSFVVVASGKEHTVETAVEALTDCWKPLGLKAAIQETWQVQRPERPYTLVVVKAVDDLAALRPMRVEFDIAGIGHLVLAPTLPEPVFLPLERWMAADGGAIQQNAGVFTLRTPPAGNAYAFTYAPLTVPAAGRYYFRLRGTPQTGQIAFGAFPADQSKWLTVDIFGRRTTTGYEMSFWVDLKQGDTVILRIANKNPTDAASTFILDSVTVAAPQ